MLCLNCKSVAHLRAGGSGTVEVKGARTRLTGIEVEGPERDALSLPLNTDVFDYDSYQRKMSRRIAVLALVPQS